MNNDWNNRRAYDAFRQEAVDCQPSLYAVKPLKVRGIEWAENGSTGIPLPAKCSIEELSARPPCPLRIVFAPLDVPGLDAIDVDDFIRLFELYSIPGAFVSERLHSVACSFGSSQSQEGLSHTWFHFLCKEIPVVRDRIVNTNKRDGEGADLEPVGLQLGEVCLLFSHETTNRGSAYTYRRGWRLPSRNTSWQEILEDPYCLFNIVFESLHDRIVEKVLSLAKVYGNEEQRILRSAGHPGTAADNIDFVGIHVICRHLIYLLEATEGMLATLKSTKDHHEEISNSSNSYANQQIQAGFRHRRMMLKSMDLRLKSMEKRTRNIINLSFNLVMQEDSRVMKADSGAMKTIAIMTMLFLPFQAVVTLFSTQFFDMSDDSIGVNHYFWLIWVLSIPLTLLVMFVWHRFQERRKKAILGGEQPFTAEKIV